MMVTLRMNYTSEPIEVDIIDVEISFSGGPPKKLIDMINKASILDSLCIKSTASDLESSASHIQTAAYDLRNMADRIRELANE